MSGDAPDRRGTRRLKAFDQHRIVSTSVQPGHTAPADRRLCRRSADRDEPSFAPWNTRSNCTWRRERTARACVDVYCGARSCASVRHGCATAARSRSTAIFRGSSTKAGKQLLLGLFEMSLENTECRDVSAGGSIRRRWHRLWFCSRNASLHSTTARSSRGRLGSPGVAGARARSASRRVAHARIVQARPGAGHSCPNRATARAWKPLGRPQRRGRTRIDHPRCAGRGSLLPGSARRHIRPGQPARRLGFSDARHRCESGSTGPRDRTVRHSWPVPGCSIQTGSAGMARRR